MQFQLLPFENTEMSSDLQLNGDLSFSEELQIRYQLSGALDRVLISEKNISPQRKDKLWEKTCFEFFLQPLGSLKYFEWNFSPSGDWNQFEFDSYRERSKAAHLLPAPEIKTKRDNDQLELLVGLKLSSLKRLSKSWRMGVTAVLEHTDGLKSYWALKHMIEKPDFHQADSFELKGVL